MKIFFKKLVVLCLSLSMLTACSDGDNSTATQTPTPSQSTTIENNISDNVNETTDNIVDSSDNIEETQKEYGTVSIDNFNQTIEFTEIPQKVISMNLNTAEIVVALGGTDNIIGVATGNFGFSDVGEEYSSQVSNLLTPEEINSGVPTLENLISMSPNLIIANSYYFNVPAFGTMEDFKSNGIEFFIPEGSYVTNATIENTYTDIENLGKIFNNESKASEIISSMKALVESVSTKVSNEEPVTMVLIDNVKEDGSFGVAGGIGIANNLIELAGGKNIFDDVEAQFSTISVEDIIARNPSVIVFSDYTSREDDVESNTEYITTTTEFSNIDAIVNGDIYSIPLYMTFPSMQNAEAVEMISTFLYPDLF